MSVNEASATLTRIHQKESNLACPDYDKIILQLEELL